MNTLHNFFIIYNIHVLINISWGVEDFTLPIENKGFDQFFNK